jgi:hypothetical protein
MEKWLVFLLDTNIWLERQRGEALYESEIRSTISREVNTIGDRSLLDIQSQ